MHCNNFLWPRNNYPHQTCKSISYLFRNWYVSSPLVIAPRRSDESKPRVLIFSKVVEARRDELLMITILAPELAIFSTAIALQFSSKIKPNKLRSLPHRNGNCTLVNNIVLISPYKWKWPQGKAAFHHEALQIDQETRPAFITQQIVTTSTDPHTTFHLIKQLPIPLIIQTLTLNVPVSAKYRSPSKLWKAFLSVPDIAQLETNLNFDRLILTSLSTNTYQTHTKYAEKNSQN